jgi:NitT/TauT family transport system ATP-binding protein
LGSAGIDPDRDIAIRVLPPPFMADALKAGEIDGYSAGEPWNSKAVRMGVGELVAFGSRLWESGPEKVLAMREDWAEEHPDLVDPLLRAVDEAAAWCDNPANRAELARMLSGELYLRQPADLIMHALEGRLRVSAKVMVEDANFILYHRHAANFPWRSQALWIYSQLVRWGYLSASPDAEQAASHVFRSDIYRRALANSPTSLPAASLKVEGALPSAHPVASSRGGLTLAPDRFFDGRTFDPERIGEYLAEQNLSLN